MGSQLLQAGRLRERVTIERDGTPTRDEWNQEIAGAATQTTRFAAVTPAPGTERFANAENAATAPMRFVFRWEADLVRETDRLIHDGLTYDVKSVTPIGHREGIEVLGVARSEG